MDDVCREILYLLPPRDLYTMLSVNRYWNELPNEHFWKTKLEQEYPFLLSSCCQLSYSERYRIFSSPKQRVELLFGHTREGCTEYTSKLFVGDLLREFREFALLAVILFEYTQSSDYDSYFEQIRNLGNVHCGDCICVPATCDLCLFEGIFSDAIEKLNEWRNLVGVNGGLHELSVLLHFIGQAREKDQENYPIYQTLEREYAHWSSLSEEEKESKLNQISTLVGQLLPWPRE